MTKEEFIVELKKEYTEKEIQAILETIKYGSFGNCDMEFNGETHCAWGYITDNVTNHSSVFTNKKQFSGIMSSVVKKIKKHKCDSLINYITNWWGKNSNDVLFVNIDLVKLDVK